MEIKISVPDYDRYSGLEISWVTGHEIEVTIENEEVLIVANKEGLMSLATQLLTLAQDAVPCERHIHLSQDSGLADGSVELTIGKR